MLFGEFFTVGMYVFQLQCNNKVLTKQHLHQEQEALRGKSHPRSDPQRMCEGMGPLRR